MKVIPDADQLLLLAIRTSVLAGNEIMNIYRKDNYHQELKEDNSPLTEADQAAHRIISECLQESGIPVLSEEGKQIPYSERKLWKDFWLVDPLDGTKEFIKRNGEFTVNIALISQGEPVIGVIYTPAEDLLHAGNKPSGACRIKNVSTMVSAGYTLERIFDAGIKLPLPAEKRAFRVVASRSHISDETLYYISILKKQYPELQTVSRGSALKFCLLAEGNADVYPRFGPTWEWDSGAGHALVNITGGTLNRHKENQELEYNKENLLNPWFIAARKGITPAG